jgi:cell division protein FtsB
MIPRKVQSKAMQQKLKQYEQRVIVFVKQLHDVKFAGMVLFLVIVLLISWSGVKAIQTNYQLQKQISLLGQQNRVQQLTNNNLALENQYYNTDTYLDLSARLNFGLAAPGEKEIVVPSSVALTYTVPIPKMATQVDTPTTEQPSSQRNFEAWVNFFLHRQNTGD